MVGLKKRIRPTLKASSLTEVIVATTILLVVFGIALVTLNNIMMSTLKKDTAVLETRIEKLIYQYKNKQLKVPISYVEESILIQVTKQTHHNIKYLNFSITDIITKKNSNKRMMTIQYE